jgi:hypothetical protein
MLRNQGSSQSTPCCMWASFTPSTPPTPAVCTPVWPTCAAQAESQVSRPCGPGYVLCACLGDTRMENLPFLIMARAGSLASKKNPHRGQSHRRAQREQGPHRAGRNAAPTASFIRCSIRTEGIQVAMASRVLPRAAMPKSTWPQGQTRKGQSQMQSRGELWERAQRPEHK